MISPKKALDSILENVSRLPIERVHISKAAGRILDEKIVATTDSPPFDNSAMDGYAVCWQDVSDSSRETPVSLKLRETIRAGALAKERLSLGEAMKIMTGATVPPGADTVVMQEKTELQQDKRVVSILHSPKKGEHIRFHGEDIRRGSVLMEEGSLIRPYEIAVLASQGICEVAVVKKPVVAVRATGDELVDISDSLSPGMLRNSNGPALASELFKWGFDYIDMGISGDDQEELEAKVSQALNKADVLIISGGVSVGDYDFTREVLRRVGVEEVFWKAAIKPGKPLMFGTWNPGPATKKPVFGMPGNPVAVLVCVEEFVRPALEKMQGYSPSYPSYHLAGKAKNKYKTPEERQQFIFCKVTPDEKLGFSIEIIRPQGSAMMGMACTANALAISPVGTSLIKEGDVLSFRWLK
ncbi:MAG: gephyrin-like molybdotransferase Glp [Nitrospinota bacterium]